MTQIGIFFHDLDLALSNELITYVLKNLKKKKSNLPIPLFYFMILGKFMCKPHVQMTSPGTTCAREELNIWPRELLVKCTHVQSTKSNTLGVCTYESLNRAYQTMIKAGAFSLTFELQSRDLNQNLVGILLIMRRYHKCVNIRGVDGYTFPTLTRHGRDHFSLIKPNSTTSTVKTFR